MAPSRLYQQPHNQQPNNRLAVSTGIAGQSPVPQCHESGSNPQPIANTTFDDTAPDLD